MQSKFGIFLVQCFCYYCLTMSLLLFCTSISNVYLFFCSNYISLVFFPFQLNIFSLDSFIWLQTVDGESIFKLNICDRKKTSRKKLYLNTHVYVWNVFMIRFSKRSLYISVFFSFVIRVRRARYMFCSIFFFCIWTLFLPWNIFGGFENSCTIRLRRVFDQFFL